MAATSAVSGTVITDLPLAPPLAAVVKVSRLEAGSRMASCSACPGFRVYRAAGASLDDVDELAAAHRRSHARVAAPAA